MSEYYLVDVKSITCHVPRSQFQADELDMLAQSILTTKGLLLPLLLKQTAINSFEVLAGDRQYYAAVRAMEINPRAAEMVNAFIIPMGLENAALDQFNHLSMGDPTPLQWSTSPTVSSDLEQRLMQLESLVQSAFIQLQTAQTLNTQRLEQQIIQSNLPKPDPLTMFNSAPIPDLIHQFTQATTLGAKAKKVVEDLDIARQQSPFTSYSDLVNRVRGLGEKSVLKIIETWKGTD